MEKRQLEVHQFAILKIREKDNSNLTNPSDIDGRDLLKVIYDSFVGFVNSLVIKNEEESEDSDAEAEDKKKESKGIVKFRKLDSLSSTESRYNIFINPTKRCVYGKISTGYYGKVDDVFNVKNESDVPEYIISKDHSVQKPFFFMIIVPEIKNVGYLILEREGTHGIKQIFSWVFHRFFRDSFPKFNMNITHFIEEEVVKKYVADGDYSSITLSRNYLPSDIAERYGLERFNTSDYVIQLSIIAKNGKKLSNRAKDRIVKVFNGQQNGYFTNNVFSKIGFDRDSNIKVKSRFNNIERTIDLSDTMKFKPYYDINVDLDDKNYSDINSIKDEAIRLIEELGLEVY